MASSKQENEQKSKYIWRLVGIAATVFCIALTVVCVLFVIGHDPVVPTAADITGNSKVSCTLVQPKLIVGRALYYDVDAILFEYLTTNMDHRDFFEKVRGQVTASGWVFSEDTGTTMKFAANPPGHGELRISKDRKRTRVVVGCWCSTTDQSEFAYTHLWSKMEP